MNRRGFLGLLPAIPAAMALKPAERKICPICEGRGWSPGPDNRPSSPSGLDVYLPTIYIRTDLFAMTCLPCKGTGLTQES